MLDLRFLGCSMKNFALIGASGYIAKRHMQAILVGGDWGGGRGAEVFFHGNRP